MPTSSIRRAWVLLVLLHTCPVISDENDVLDSARKTYLAALALQPDLDLSNAEDSILEWEASLTTVRAAVEHEAPDDLSRLLEHANRIPRLLEEGRECKDLLCLTTTTLNVCTSANVVQQELETFPRLFGDSTVESYSEAFDACADAHRMLNSGSPESLGRAAGMIELMAAHFQQAEADLRDHLQEDGND